MKALKLVGLGVVIWGLGLLWPEVNHLLRTPVMIGMTLGLGMVALSYVLIQRLNYRHPDNGSGQDHPSHPMPIAATR